MNWHVFLLPHSVSEFSQHVHSNSFFLFCAWNNGIMGILQGTLAKVKDVGVVSENSVYYISIEWILTSLCDITVVTS